MFNSFRNSIAQITASHLAPRDLSEEGVGVDLADPRAPRANFICTPTDCEPDPSVDAGRFGSPGAGWAVTNTVDDVSYSI